MTNKAAEDSTTKKASAREKSRRLFYVRLAEMTTKLAGAFLVPALAGIYIDKRYDSQYLWTIVGIMAGIALGIYVMVSVIKKIDKEVSL